MSARQVRAEPYEGDRQVVAELFRVPVEEVEPDEHAHHAHNGATYSHGHSGGSLAHSHRLTVEWDPQACEWRGVDLEPDEQPVVTEEMVRRADEAATAAGASARIHPEVLRAILATVVRGA